MRCRICRIQINIDEVRDGEAHILTGMLYGNRSGPPVAQANRGAVHQRCLNRSRILQGIFSTNFMYAFEIIGEKMKKFREKIEKVG